MSFWPPFIFLNLFLLVSLSHQAQTPAESEKGIPTFPAIAQGLIPTEPDYLTASLRFERDFEAAYQAYPAIPRGLLEAISWTRTRIRNVQPDQEEASCMGLPSYWGPMGLLLESSGWFRSHSGMLPAGERMAGAGVNTAQNVALIASILQRQVQSGTDWTDAVLATSEIPDVSAFARASYQYSVLQLMTDPEFRRAFSVTVPAPSLRQIFGSNLEVLSANLVIVTGEEIGTEQGYVFDPSEASLAGPCFDAPGVIWNEASPTNYSSRAGTPISAVTVHTMQGYYAGSISWFQNPAANVSAHYLMRASDGQLTQMVCESDKAWHVGTENPYTVGIEHEGFVTDPSWYTSTVYQTSAALVRDISSDHGILPLRTYFKEAHSGVVTLGACTRIKGHQHFPNQSHTDPGIHWDWDRFYKLVNPSAPTTTYSTSSGTVSDPGGPAANYGDDQRRFYRIDPAGSTPVSLTFSSFNLELNWDYLFVYDGTTADAPLLGVFTGTSSPGTLLGSSGSLLLDFRSDCSITAPGFVATWSTGGTASCAAPTGTYTGPIGWTSATVNWNPVTAATGYQISGRRLGTSSWQTLNTELTSKWLGIFTTGTTYEWRVRAYCGGSLGWSGWSTTNSFTTNSLRDETESREGSVVSLFPNPAASFIEIQSAKAGRFSLLNSQGFVVGQGNVTEGSSRISLEDFSSGLYLLQLEDGSAATFFIR